MLRGRRVDSDIRKHFPCANLLPTLHYLTVLNCIGCWGVQAHVEELRRLRAAEESALTALADEELAARFNGDVTLTVRDDGVTVLSPEQACSNPIPPSKP